MPNPSASLATLRPDLAGSVEEFSLSANRMEYIGLRLFPALEVAKPSGTFGKIPIEQLLQTHETKRAPGAAYSRGQWKFESDSYTCVENGWEEPIDDREAEMYAEYFDAELISAERARNIVLQNHEIACATAVFSPSTYTPTAVTNEWDDYTNATPISDVETAVLSFWQTYGIWPNGIVLPRSVFRNLRNCDEIIERIQSAGAGSPVKAGDITAQQIGMVFDLPNVMIAGSAKNTANPAAGSATVKQIWSNEYAAIVRVAETNDVREPALGRTFHWSADGSQIGAAMETYRDETVRANIVRARMDTHVKTILPLVKLLSNITTSSEG
jgi:hypothetical protein